MSPLVKFKDPVPSCVKILYHSPGNAGHTERQHKSWGRSATVPQSRAAPVNAVFRRPGTTLQNAQILIWMWSSDKTHVAWVAIKVHSNLTRSKNILTQWHADMNAIGQMKEKGLQKHQEDKMNP